MFGAPAVPPGVVLPIDLSLAVAVSWIGAMIPLRAAVRVRTAMVVEGGRGERRARASARGVAARATTPRHAARATRALRTSRDARRRRQLPARSSSGARDVPAPPPASIRSHSWRSLAVGAMLASALLTTYDDLDSKMSGEFRRYGANLIVAPAAGADTLPDSALDAANQQGAAVPYLYVVGSENDRDVVLAGTDFARLAKSPPAWSVAGEWPARCRRMHGRRASRIARGRSTLQCRQARRKPGGSGA